ncbi:uncharacterized protein LOC110225093 [Arabidopsis lyrata subsp. lyrata]|uniref:uncharacterized protein LOC110225093 n=1 Tax=Arabidopsis lyrata subsp. lyrata TaxID=81972 RepID=UPI000A29B771|nr:uncharacterized protein LOC110225093 [Arabidopsis lyrata subsp. lyrata]|eukprot:XP_020869498.1 uncharacterized protein LOC110225093 [Arabidopsis lyrata subsp. lyrata]
MSFATQVSRSTSSPLIRDTSKIAASSSNSFNPRFGPGNRDPSRYCTSCGRTGHEVSACFQVVGYPDWWEDRPRSKPDSRSFGRGRGRNSQPRANNTEIVSANVVTTTPNKPLTDADRQGFHGFTDEQWSTIQRVYGTGNSNDRLSGPNYQDADWNRWT